MIINRRAIDHVLSPKAPLNLRLKDSDSLFEPYYMDNRKAQKGSFKQLRFARYFILNAPTGAGKAGAGMFLVADRLSKNPQMKAIISVPETTIEQSFSTGDGKAIYLYYSGRKTPVLWDLDTSHNLCTYGNKKADLLLEFLQNKPSENFNLRTMTCTHGTLRAAYKKNPQAFTDTFLLLDEAHHAESANLEDASQEYNALGHIVNSMLKNEQDGNHIGLMTATFFRSNRTSIVDQKHYSNFKRFDMLMDEYLSELNIERIKYEFVVGGENYTDSLNALFAEKIAKTIVFVPRTDSRAAFPTKEEGWQVAYAAIAGHSNPIVKGEDDIVTLVQRDDKWIQVINLVDDRNPILRNKRKDYIKKAHDHSDASKLDVIITMALFNEGGNWRHADRAIIIGPRNHPVNATQIFGRLLRDAPGKKVIEYKHVMPLGEKNKQKQLNEYLLSIIGVMLLRSVINPVKLNTASAQNANPLMEAFEKDTTKVQDAIKQITSKFLTVCENGLGKSDSLEDYAPVVSSVLSKYGIQKSKHSIISEQLFKMHMREGADKVPKSKKEGEVLALEGIDVSNVDYELVKSMGVFGGYAYYLADIDSKHGFAAIRQAFGTTNEDDLVSQLKEILDKDNPTEVDLDILRNFRYNRKVYNPIDDDTLEKLEQLAASKNKEYIFKNGFLHNAHQNFEKLKKLGYVPGPKENSSLYEFVRKTLKRPAPEPESQAEFDALKTRYSNVLPDDHMLTREEKRKTRNMVQAQNVVAYVQKNGYPIDPEHQVYRWLSRQLSLKHRHLGKITSGEHRNFDPEIEAYLNKNNIVLEKKNVLQAKNASKFETKLYEMIDCIQNGKSPSGNLKTFMNNVRVGRAYAEHKVAIEKIFKEKQFVWDQTAQALKSQLSSRQIENAREFCDWCQKYEAYPSQTSLDPLEKRLANWLFNRKSSILHDGKKAHKRYLDVEEYCASRGYPIR